MTLFRKLVSVVLFFAISASADISIPKVKFEALKSGGFRAYIPDTAGTDFFALYANVNEPIDAQTAGQIRREARTTTNGFWVLEFSNKLKFGDVVNYWVFVQSSGKGYRKNNLSWTVTELQDHYGPLTSNHCNPAFTTVNGEKVACAGQLIIEDEFNKAMINTSTWIVEHRIPTYTGPSYEFNTYENRDETRFLKDGKLYLKPIIKQAVDGMLGSLNLQDGCTADSDSECHIQQVPCFLLPPVKSAKITSKASFKYGRVEVKAKLPAGEWIVPLIELQPKQKTDENSTKLWIAYSRGNNYLTENGRIDIGSRLLFAGPVIHPAEPGRSKKLVTRRSEVPYSNDFHVYTLEWAPGKMSFFFDGEEYGGVISRYGFAEPSLGIGDSWTAPEAPFDEEYVLSLGVAVGGFNHFPDGFTSGNNRKPWVDGESHSVTKFSLGKDTWARTWDGDDAALQIDYVKVWAV